MKKNKAASSYEVIGLKPGTKYYLAVKTQTKPHRLNPNKVVSEFSQIAAARTLIESAAPPFGEFSTPIDGSIARSSIPVTGWALDDLGVEGVQIYRESGETPVYIGDAVFIEGARPDVEQAYPGYPNNHKAGWGYMMLTNFLPNGGNGTFNIHAIATDIEGNQVTLGIKTVICDNANAVKPFGAIDTPSQGGTASGGSYINWGWTLTPRPNSISIDGSSIHVFVNGVNLGHPTYNIYRSDITALFPDYANSDGAVGYFYLDTTAYENGVHTIQWTVTDSAGNTDGIGSRYFTVQNPVSSTSLTNTKRGQGSLPPCLDENPRRNYPIKVLKGYNTNVHPQKIHPDKNGFITLEIKELERVEIHLKRNEEFAWGMGHGAWWGSWRGYQVIGKQLRPLPPGSFLDAEQGIFCWLPGPGFVGYYQLVFIEKSKSIQIGKQNINVIIEPGFGIKNGRD
jgi:hypothetical protein